MNVQCAGGGVTALDPAPFGLGPTHYERPTHGEPCGWRGLRVGAVTGEWPGTIKPCPRCGGRVQLIPEGES